MGLWGAGAGNGVGKAMTACTTSAPHAYRSGVPSGPTIIFTCVNCDATTERLAGEQYRTPHAAMTDRARADIAQREAQAKGRERKAPSLPWRPRKGDGRR